MIYIYMYALRRNGIYLDICMIADEELSEKAEDSEKISNFAAIYA